MGWTIIDILNAAQISLLRALLRNILTRVALRKISAPLFITFILYVILLIGTACNYRHDKLSESKSPLEISQNDLSFTTIKEGILKSRCLDCHSAGHSASRIPFETREDLIDSPLEIVIPGNPDDSGLIIAVTRTDGNRMPPPDSGMPSLTAEEINVIRQWILEGAK